MRSNVDLLMFLPGGTATAGQQKLAGRAPLSLVLAVQGEPPKRRAHFGNEARLAGLDFLAEVIRKRRLVDRLASRRILDGRGDLLAGQPNDAHATLAAKLEKLAGNATANVAILAQPSPESDKAHPTPAVLPAPEKPHTGAW